MILVLHQFRDPNWKHKFWEFTIWTLVLHHLNSHLEIFEVLGVSENAPEADIKKAWPRIVTELEKGFESRRLRLPALGVSKAGFAVPSWQESWEQAGLPKDVFPTIDVFNLTSRNWFH